MRQLHIFSIIKPKLDMGLFVDLCLFTNSGKNTEIKKQSHVKFGFNRKKYGAVSYLLSCIGAKQFRSTPNYFGPV